MVFSSVSSISEAAVQQLGYAGLFLLMVLEHVFPPVPSELILPLAGFEVSRGGLTFFGAVLSATAGSVLGASILYALARRGGRPLVHRYGALLRLDRSSLARAEERFQRRGAPIVLVGRLIPGVRSLVSIPPGLLRMPYLRYATLTAVGSLTWNAVLISAGQALGNRWGQVGDVIAPIATAGLFATVVVASALGGRWWWRRAASDQR